MIPVVITPEAEQDIAGVYAWYEGEAAGLGEEFVQALEAVWAALTEHPQMYPAVRGEIRRAVVRRFPYLVFYRVFPDVVTVLGVYHAHRRPATIRSTVEERSRRRQAE